jgi:hypothetical protein
MFSDSLMAHCRLLGVTSSNGALDIEMCVCTEAESGLELAEQICGKDIAKMLSISLVSERLSHRYDRVIWLKDANAVAGAAFMKMKSRDVYEITCIACPAIVDTRDPFYILQCLAAEAAAACGCQVIMCHETNGNYNRAHLHRMASWLGFYWFDKNGNPTTGMEDFPKKKQENVAIIKCYKKCRSLFPHPRVYFASCLPRGALGAIIANGASGDGSAWDIYLEYGNNGRITMKKTETGYDVRALEVDAAHFEKGKSLAREAAVYDSGLQEGLVLTFFV